MKITKIIAEKLGKEFKIDFSVIPFNEWYHGLNMELEHRNITHGSHKITAKIVIAHLKEYPDYYKYLIKLEKNREKYWINRKKPSIFLKK